MMAICARSSLSMFTPCRQEQREHHAGHEQQADQRHAADQLDVEHAEHLDRRQLAGAPAERHQDRQREGEGQAEGRQDQRDRQAAPALLRHVGQAEHAAPHQHADQRQRRRSRSAPAPCARSGASPRRHRAPMNSSDAERRAPLLLVRVAAEQDQAVLVGDHRPAGADALRVAAGACPDACGVSAPTRRR